MDVFKYDVALSFTAIDEPLAFELYQFLKPTLSCFIYSEEQKKLAGRDGEKLFNQVFTKESRIVVILFNESWGQTNWTRIEETAIRNRGFEYGYDFTILIPTADKITPPKWMPKNRLWVGLKRWGIESAAAVIESRVAESGGEIKEVSAADLIVKQENEKRKLKKINYILQSEQGLSLALEELSRLNTCIEEFIDKVKGDIPDWHYKLFRNSQESLNVQRHGLQLIFHFNQKFSNTLDESYLVVSLFEGYFNLWGYSDAFNTPRLIKRSKYLFELDLYENKLWKNVKNQKTIKSKKLIEDWFTELEKNVS